MSIFFVSAYAFTVLAQKEKNIYNELANIWYEVFGIFMFMIGYDKIWYKKKSSITIIRMLI